MFLDYVRKVDPEIRRAAINKNHFYAEFVVGVKPAGKTTWRKVTGTTGSHSLTGAPPVLYKLNSGGNMKPADFWADFNAAVASPDYIALRNMPADADLKTDTFKKRNLFYVRLHTIERRDDPMMVTCMVLMGVKDHRDAVAFRMTGSHQTVAASDRPYDDQRDIGFYEERQRPWSPEFAMGRFW